LRDRAVHTVRTEQVCGASINGFHQFLPPEVYYGTAASTGAVHAIDSPGNDERIITLHPRARVKPLAEPTKCTD